MEELFDSVLEQLKVMSIPIDTEAAGDRVWKIVTATDPKVRIYVDRFDALLLVDCYSQPYGLKADWYNYLRAHESCGLNGEGIARVVASILAETSKNTVASRVKGDT